MATVRKKVDNRIRVQIENGVALQHRTLFVVVGDRGRDQVIPSLPAHSRHISLHQEQWAYFTCRVVNLHVCN